MLELSTSRRASATSKPRSLRRSRWSWANTACILDVRLEMSPAASGRLVDALQGGEREFVLTSSDGHVSAPVRLSIAAVSASEHQLAGGRIVIDWSKSTIAHRECRVSLSRTELRLLAALLDSDGGPVSRAELIGRVWAGDNLDLKARENALTVYICSLRKRFVAIGLGSALQTIRNVGYVVNL